MVKFITVICLNDYPEAVYEDEDEADIKLKDLQDKANKKMKREGGMIFYHKKRVPFIEANK